MVDDIDIIYCCDGCGDEFDPFNAYDSFIDFSGKTIYLIDGWYGEYDNEQLCCRCKDCK